MGAITLALLFLIANNSSGKPPEQSRQATEQFQSNTLVQEPKRDERGADAMPLVVKNYSQQISEADKNYEEDRREKAETDWWSIAIGKASIVVGILTAIILIVQAIVFGVQAARLKETIAGMKKIADDQRRDVKNTIAVAKEAAEAAKRTADTTEEAMVSNQRPWLMITGVRHKEPVHRRAGSLTFLLDVKNVGRSPATNIITRSTVMPMRYPTESDITNAIGGLAPDNLSSGRTLVPTDSDAYEEFCVANIEPTTDRLDLAFVLVCVFYSFTFKAAKCTGYYVGGYRVFEAPVEEDQHDLSVEFVRYYSHAD